MFFFVKLEKFHSFDDMILLSLWNNSDYFENLIFNVCGRYATRDVPCILILTRNCVSYVPESRDRSADTGKLVINEVAAGFNISGTIGPRTYCVIYNLGYGNLGKCGIGDASQKRRRLPKGWSSFGASCVLASNLWKNEMRRISVPSTSIFGRKFTEVTTGLSLRPASASSDLFLHCITTSARSEPIIAGCPKGRDLNRRILFGRNRGWVYSHTYPCLNVGAALLYYEKPLRGGTSTWKSSEKLAGEL